MCDNSSNPPKLKDATGDLKKFWNLLKIPEKNSKQKI
jgi:hypothetical protein